MPKKIINPKHSAIPAQNEQKPLESKVNEEKSLQNFEEKTETIETVTFFTDLWQEFSSLVLPILMGIDTIIWDHFSIKYAVE